MIAIFGLQLREPTHLAVTSPGATGAQLMFAERGPSTSALTWTAIPGTGDWSLTLGPGDFIIRVEAVSPPVAIALGTESILVSTNEASSIVAWLGTNAMIEDPKDPTMPPLHVASGPVQGSASADWFQRHLLPLAATARAGIKTL